MSSCLSGGRAAYGFDLDIVVKTSSPSPATSSRSTHSSHSSTLSESGNSPLAISTKGARTPRKRPNQTYNEAAALLSTVYPYVFCAKSLPKLCRKQTRPFDSSSESHAELLPPFPALTDAGFLLHQCVTDVPSPRVEPPRPTSSSEPSSVCLSPASIEIPGSPAELDDEFDAESILEEEVCEGIDSIMGNLSVAAHGVGDGGGEDSPHYRNHTSAYLGNVALGHGFGRMLKFGYGMRRALRRSDDGEWWRSPPVEVLKIAPKLKPAIAPAPAPPPPPPAAHKKKKKVQKVERVLAKASKLEEKAAASGKAESEMASAHPQQRTERDNTKPVLSLKLDYGDVLKAWSGRGSPFFDAGDSSEPPADTIARLSQIELFPEGSAGGALREASVLRYKEKRRSRLFSKKIRYQVRKVNADCRPRMKASGRFVRRPALS